MSALLPSAKPTHPAAVAAATPASSAPASAPATQPNDAVSKTFKANFPKAVIEKLEYEVENGVGVYDFEFKNGDLEQECDIAADGTLEPVVRGRPFEFPHDVVVDADGKLVGLVRGAALFEIEAFEIGAQAGQISLVNFFEAIKQ